MWYIGELWTKVLRSLTERRAIDVDAVSVVTLSPEGKIDDETKIGGCWTWDAGEMM